MSLLTLENVSVEIAEKLILDNISLRVERGELLSIIGPNGAGKSTLLKVILGLISKTSGKLIKLPGLRFGYVPQKLKINAFVPISVMRFLQLLPDKYQARMSVVCNDLGINNLLDKPIHNLSGGELQKVLLARALLNKPDILFLDEPAQGVDLNGQNKLYELIARNKAKYNCAVVMVSHDLHVVMSGTDKVICLNQHICCQGLPQEIAQNPKFLEIFGAENSRLALYTHQHNHQHNLDGSVET